MKPIFYTLEGKYASVYVHKSEVMGTYILHSLLLGGYCPFFVTLGTLNLFRRWRCGWPFLLPFLVGVTEEDAYDLILLRLNKGRDARLEPGALFWCGPSLFGHGELLRMKVGAM
jgi:hypothetical protein